jgi:hypothetical protein
MSEEKALTVKKQDAPVEWGTRGEIAALADRFATMLPGAKKMSREEVLTAAQYARMMDLNPFRGEVYFYKDWTGKLCVVDGYKALARWARKEQPYTDRYDALPTDEGELFKVRCWILREDRKPFIREYVEMGASFKEAFEIAATFADGVIMVKETKTKKGTDRDPPTGWTWEQVARKRALKNALNLSHGAPSPREIAQLSWEVNGVKTIPADWDGTDDLNGHEAERLAEMQAHRREWQQEWNEKTPDEQQAKAAENSQLLYGDDEFDGFDTPPEPTDNGPVWEGEIVDVGEDEPEQPAESANGDAGINSPAALVMALNEKTDHYKMGGIHHTLNALKKINGDNYRWPDPDNVKGYMEAYQLLIDHAEAKQAGD